LDAVLVAVASPEMASTVLDTCAYPSTVACPGKGRPVARQRISVRRALLKTGSSNVTRGVEVARFSISIRAEFRFFSTFLSLSMPDQFPSPFAECDQRDACEIDLDQSCHLPWLID